MTNETKRAALTIAAIRENVLDQPARSAWKKGVKQYALDLIDELAEAVKYGWIGPDDICNKRLLEKALLNGAASWPEYSAGGCALIYDGEIAARLCCPSELKRTDNGRRDPNSRETWIDVQARALYQASRLILGAAF